MDVPDPSTMKIAIEKLQKDFRILKAQVTKLSNKKILFDIQGFNEQIATLNKKITEMEIVSLETRRFVANNFIEDLRLFLENWLNNPNTPLPSQLYQQVHEFLIRESATAQQAIAQSPSPISVAERFREKCEKYFKSCNLKAFQE
jgi:hypothetical protein